MNTFNRYEDAEKFAPFCVALGSFDGVHVGHQKLIEVLKEDAKLFNTATMVYTFANHPRKVLMPDKALYMITDSQERETIMTRQGIDVLFLEDFSQIVKMSAESFIKDILVGRFQVKSVIVGYNYRFGFNGEGTAELLKEYGDAMGFRVQIIPAVEVQGEIVSSTLIRHMIRNGDVERVPKYLGRPYAISGTVVSGKQNGRSMGIRTANLGMSAETIIPKKGVYISSTRIEGSVYKSLTNVGLNPTFQGDKLSIETYIMDFDGDIYGKEIEVVFLKWHRDEKKFENPNELVEQIKFDIKCRRNYES